MSFNGDNCIEVFCLKLRNFATDISGMRHIVSSSPKGHQSRRQKLGITITATVQ